MNGNFSYFSLGELLQSIVPEKSGTITVSARGMEGALYFALGELVHAELTATNGKFITGEDAFYSIAILIDGVFSVSTKKSYVPGNTLPKSFRTYMMQLSTIVSDYSTFAALCTYNEKKLIVHNHQNIPLNKNELVLLKFAESCTTFGELSDKAELWFYPSFLIAAGLFMKRLLVEKGQNGQRSFFDIEQFLTINADKTAMYEFIINELFGKLHNSGHWNEESLNTRLYELSKQQSALSAYDIVSFKIRLYDDALKNKKTIKKLEHALEIFLNDILVYCEEHRLFPGYVFFLWNVLVRRCGYYWIRRSKERLAVLV